MNITPSGEAHSTPPKISHRQFTGPYSVTTTNDYNYRAKYQSRSLT